MMTNDTTGDCSPIILTREYLRFAEFCNACARDRYIGVCYGSSGVGKTLSARHYAAWHLLEETIAVSETRNERRPIPEALIDCRTVFYTPAVTNTPRRVEREVVDLCMLMRRLIHQGRDLHKRTVKGEKLRTTELIIVDEADRLKDLSLEQLRDIYDRGRVGLVLIGIPGIERRLSRYAQFYSRVGFVHQFRALSGNEFREALAQKWQDLRPTVDFTDPEAVAAITRITAGNFRLLARMLSQIGRILEINQLQVVTQEIVEAARESLVIGVA